VGFEFSRASGGLREHVSYVAEFLEPAIAKMAGLGFDEVMLHRGLAHLRSLAERPDGSMSQIVYRAHAEKPMTPRP
jgi:hypothetical protein